MSGGLGPKIPRILGVVGAGQMGAGIAQVAASKGVHVVLADVIQSSLDTGMATIHRSFAKKLQKQQATQQEVDETLSHLKMTLSLKVDQASTWVANLFVTLRGMILCRS